MTMNVRQALRRLHQLADGDSYLLRLNFHKVSWGRLQTSWEAGVGMNNFDLSAGHTCAVDRKLDRAVAKIEALNPARLDAVFSYRETRAKIQRDIDEGAEETK
jgi:hypothetical protein